MQIQNTFGSSANANAYTLYYRMVEKYEQNGADFEQKNEVKNEFEHFKSNVPNYIKKRIEEEISKLQLKEQMKFENL